MPINRNEIIQLVAEVSTAEDLKVTVKESAKGALIVGSSAFAGGILGGPAGLAVGGMFGSFVALAHGKGKYRSAADIILYDMTPAQHKRLANSVQKIIADLRVEDFTLLLPLVLSNVATKELILKQLVLFLQNEMSMAIAS